MTIREVTLTDALEGFIAEQVESGAYRDPSEVVRAGLRMLKSAEEVRAARLQRLRAALQEGLDARVRGEGAPIDDVDDFFDRMNDEIEAEAAAIESRAAAE